MLDVSRQVTRKTGPQKKRRSGLRKGSLLLAKPLGATADHQPDIFMQALERFRPRLVKALEDNYIEALKESQEEP